MSEGHARLGPSNHRWPNCPGSVLAEAPYPDIPGEAAIDGTGSHLLLEYCLKHGVRADCYDGQIIGVNHQDNPNGWLIDLTRCERVQECLDYVAKRHSDLGKEYPGATITVQAESHSDPGAMFGRNDWWGTVDVTIEVSDEGQCLFMEVIDYKDGRGWVNAKDNTQLISYLGGKVREYIASGPQMIKPLVTDRLHGCRMTIVQPKTTPTVRSEDIPVPVLIDKLEELGLAAWRTDQPDAPLIADDKGGKGHCRWCKHKPNCTAQTTNSLEAMTEMSNQLSTTGGQGIVEILQNATLNFNELPDSKLVELADAEAGIQALFDRIKEEIQSRIESGNHVPGYAMKPGKGSNEWNDDEEKIVKMLKARKLKLADIYPPKLVSPAQVMKSDKLTKEQKAKIQRDYVSYIAGGNKLTRVSVKEAPDVNLMFGDVAQSQTKEVQSKPASIFDEEKSKPPVSFF